MGIIGGLAYFGFLFWLYRGRQEDAFARIVLLSLGISLGGAMLGWLGYGR